MKKQDNHKQSKEYQSPQISRIELDREISLQLASDNSPMGEPEWAAYDNYQTDKWANID